MLVAKHQRVVRIDGVIQARAEVGARVRRRQRLVEGERPQIGIQGRGQNESVFLVVPPLEIEPERGFVLPFEIISLLLIAAIVGAITIARAGDGEKKEERK